MSPSIPGVVIKVFESCDTEWNGWLVLELLDRACFPEAPEIWVEGAVDPIETRSVRGDAAASGFWLSKAALVIFTNLV